MFRIDGPDAVLVKPAKVAPASEAGFFHGGNPVSGQMATMVTADWLNAVQEEIAAVVESVEGLDRSDDAQLLQAILAIIDAKLPVIEKVKNDLVYPSAFQSFYEQTPPKGWKVRNGAVLDYADEDYPELWEALQEPKNAWKCKALAEWTALSTASGGVGGVPFFVLDVDAKTIKLPDTRGDYERGAGSTYLSAVGAWHEDAIRTITGAISAMWTATASESEESLGVFTKKIESQPSYRGTGSPVTYATIGFDPSRVVPTATENRTRAFGVLPCVYLGGI